MKLKSLKKYVIEIITIQKYLPSMFCLFTIFIFLLKFLIFTKLRFISGVINDRVFALFPVCIDGQHPLTTVGARHEVGWRWHSRLHVRLTYCTSSFDEIGAGSSGDFCERASEIVRVGLLDMYVPGCHAVRLLIRRVTSPQTLNKKFHEFSNNN